MARSTTVALRLAVLGLLVAPGGCSDDRRDITTPEALAPEFAVTLSDPVEGSGSAPAGARASSSATPDVVVYASFPPGTIPGGLRIVLRNLETGFARTAPLVDGGLDPVSIPATVGDRLELVATLSGGITLHSVVRVPARRPPRVVRTVPPRGKTDVPLNARMLVVFSEPIDASTLTATSMQLLRGTQPVAGRLEFVDAGHLAAALVPGTSLAPATGYELVVSQAIRDRDGEPLEAPVAVDFTTCPNYVDPANCPPFSTYGEGIVSGIVSARSGDGVQPLADANVWGFIFMAGSGNGFRLAPAKTGADGTYRLAGVPDGFLVLYAYKDGYDQPCAATVTVRQADPITTDVELVSALDPRPGFAKVSPSISGTVYTGVPEARRPVPGARIYFEFFPDLVTATTTTNEAGQYSLCRLPATAHGWVAAVKAGYKLNGTVVVIGNDDQVVDIELTP